MAQRQRSLKADRRRRTRSKEPRSSADPEIFIKTAVRQWIDKVKRQVYVACSRVTIKTEEVDENEIQLDARFAAGEGVEPKMEPSEDEQNLSEEAYSAVPDSIVNPVEVFVNVAEDCGLVSKTDCVREESDPLGVDGELKPSALITMTEEGVLREEDYSTPQLGKRSVVVSNRMKEEAIGGELETSPSSTLEISSLGGNLDALERN